MYTYSKKHWYDIYSDIEVIFTNDDTFMRRLDYDRHYLCMIDENSSIIKLNKSMRVGMHLTENDRLTEEIINLSRNHDDFEIVFTSYEVKIEEDNSVITLYYGYVNDRGLNLGEYNLLSSVIELNLMYHDKYLQIKDSDMRMININEVWFKQKQHNRYSAKGKTYTERFGPNSIVPLEKEMHVLKYGEKIEFEWETEAFSKRYEYTGMIIPIKGENEIAGVATILDLKVVEDRYEFHMKEGREIQDLLDYFGMYYWEELENCYLLNPSGRMLIDLGYDRHEINNRGILDEYIHPDDLNEFIDGWSQNSQDELFTQFRMREKSGRYRWFLRHYKAVRNPKSGDDDFFGCMFIDIEQFKTQEKQLLDSKIKAENIAEHKSNFLANMSHEIRTPMNSIIGFGDLLLGTDLTNKQRDYIVKSNRAAKNLLGIINDILDISKIEAGKMSVEHRELSFEEVMNHLESIMKMKAIESGIDFRTLRDDKIPEYIISDGLRISQILTNLCNNAIKFTHEGYVELSLSYLQGETPKILFSITDTGIGMSQEQMNHLFIPFSQADTSTTRKYGGTGLGLSITKKLVGLLEGKIMVTSKEGKGTTFKVELPCIETVGTELRASVELTDLTPLEDYAHNPILLVEDNPVNCEIIDENLSLHGFKIDIAVNGLQAINKIKSLPNHYKLVLMDLHMPVLDGFDATEWIRTLYNEKQLPIIALTADVFNETIIQIKEVGMQEHIGKPIDVNSLNNVLKKYLKPKERDELQSMDHQVINRELALKLLGNNENLYSKISKSFIEFIRNEPVLTQDSKSIVGYLHNLKGLLGSIGADRLGKSIDNDYRILKSGKSIGNLENYLMALNDEVNQVIEALETDSGQIIIDMNSNIKRKINELKKSVSDYNVDSIDQVKQYKTEVINTYGEIIYDRLIYNLNKYDFSKAKNILDSLDD